MNKEEQEKLIIEIMQADEKDGLYKQQTAVDYLENELSRFLNQHDGSYENFEGGVKKFFAALKVAKQMEKEQIMDAYKYGHSNGIDKTFCMDDPKIKSSEQYYNETYGSETKEI